MKKLITIFILMSAIGAKAQTSRIKSYLGDSITVIKGYKQLTPIIITVTGDTARSILWYTGNISRDSTAQTSINIIFYDKNANVLDTKSIGIAESAYTKWSTLFNAVDNYIHNQISRIVLH
jgi:PKD repeat protein